MKFACNVFILNIAPLYVVIYFFYFCCCCCYDDDSGGELGEVSMTDYVSCNKSCVFAVLKKPSSLHRSRRHNCFTNYACVVSFEQVDNYYC